MTRYEVRDLRAAISEMDSQPMMARLRLMRLVAEADREHEAEDRAMDAMFGKDRPMNEAA